MKVAHVSTFPDMRCGIAFYVSDLIQALPKFEHQKFALHYGENLTKDAVYHADVSFPSNLKDLARFISQSNCDVVSLQHKFGIWGGDNGEYILDFLNTIQKPIVSTLHTTFKSNNRPSLQGSILRKLAKQSTINFVLSPKSKDTLCSALDIPRDDVTVIPHGVPDIPYVPLSFIPSNATARTKTWKLCSIGFFRPDKGLEEVLNALSVLKTLGYNFLYVIAGSPQPQFYEQEEYFTRLQELITRLKFIDYVRVEAKFFTRAEQIQLIQDTHVGIFAYQNPDQASSGTIPLVMAAGRPVICTPFEYALAKEFEIGNGVNVANDFSSAAIVEALISFFHLKSNYLQSTERLYAQTRHWKWQTVALSYMAAFERAIY
jgi:glycosyltransferase involved in cell wall biosynthesis